MEPVDWLLAEYWAGESAHVTLFTHRVNILRHIGVQSSVRDSLNAQVSYQCGHALALQGLKHPEWIVPDDVCADSPFSPCDDPALPPGLRGTKIAKWQQQQQQQQQQSNGKSPAPLSRGAIPLSVLTSEIKLVEAVGKSCADACWWQWEHRVCKEDALPFMGCELLKEWSGCGDRCDFSWLASGMPGLTHPKWKAPNCAPLVAVVNEGAQGPGDERPNCHTVLPKPLVRVCPCAKA